MDSTVETRSADRWLTVPNVITAARLVLVVPVLVWLILATDWRVTTAIVLAVFGATDWVDGFIARRFDQVSRVGVFLDPIADRFGITAIMVALALAGLLPWWVLIVIVVVDAVVAVVGFLGRSRIDSMAASRVGKLRTALVMVALPALLIGDAELPGAEVIAMIARICLVVGCLLHVVAGVGYMLRISGRMPESQGRTPLI